MSPNKEINQSIIQKTPHIIHHSQEKINDTMRSILTEVKLSLSVVYRLIDTVVHSPSVLFTTISQPSNVTSCLTNASQRPNQSVHLAASPCQKGSRI